MPPIEVIVNAAGGSFADGETEAVLREAFAANDLEIDLHLARDGGQIDEFAKEAASSDAQVVVAGGGDGTINAVAAEVVDSSKTFGVLPLGTLNHFSKDLGIPQDLAGAVATVKNGHKICVDLGEVNGRIFLNNSSIGLYPSIVRQREQQQHRLGRGKWYAAFVAALKVFRRDPFFRVEFEIDGKHFLRKTPFVFIGNNEYAMDLYHIGARPNLTDGKLSVYFLRRGGRWGVIVMLLRTFFGCLRQWNDFETILTTEIAINVRKKSVMTALDGEVVMMETPLNYRIRPKSLSVLVPSTEDIDA